MAENRILGIFPRRASRRSLPTPNLSVGATDANGALLYHGSKVAMSPEKALQLSAVYRAVDLISNAVAMLPITLFADGRRVDNDLSYLINHEPNYITTHFQLFKLVTIDMLQNGNAFLLVRRNSRDLVEELRYVKPADVTILYNEEINRKRFVLKDGREVDDGDMLHFMNFTLDGIVGHSVLWAAKHALGIAYASENTASNYFEKGGAVTGVLASKAMLNNKQKEEIRTQWKEVMANEDGGIAILGADMTFTPITMSASDAQLLETRHFNVEEIARFYGISPTLLGDLTKSSYATFEATSLDFLTNALQPRLTNIEQELNRKLLLRREKQVQGMHFAFDTTDLLRCTKTELAQYWQALIQNGIVTVNEVRRKLDFEPVAGGDENYIQLNMTTLTGVQNNTNNGEEN